MTKNKLIAQLENALIATADPDRQAAIRALLLRARHEPEQQDDDALHGFASLHTALKGRPEAAEALMYQQRWSDNVSATERYGDTETRRAERAEIAERINALTLRALGRTFVA